MDEADQLLDEHHRFVVELTRLELLASVVSLQTRDEETYGRALTPVAQRLTEGTRLDLRPLADPGDKWLVAGAKYLAAGGPVQRPAFLLRRYVHADGALVRSYLGATVNAAPGRKGYVCCLFSEGAGEALRIVSRYDLDVLRQDGDHLDEASSGTAAADGLRADASGLRWIWHSGRRLPPLGPATATLRVLPPEVAADRLDFDA